MRIGKWLMLVAVAAVLGGCSTTARMRASGLEKKADKALAARDYETAAEGYSKSIGALAQSSAALKRAYCLHELGRTAQSREALAQAANLSDAGAALLLAAESGATSADVAAAAGRLEGNALATAALGEALAREGDWAGAADAFERATQQAADGSAVSVKLFYNLTVASLKSGGYAKATEAFSAYETARGATLGSDERHLKAVVLYAAGDREGAGRVWAALDKKSRTAIAAEIGDESAVLAALGE